MRVLYALVKIGPAAREAVPALVDLAKDENRILADTAELVLEQIDPDAMGNANRL